ncbi:MAG: hypothetical protein ACRBHB_19450 [Arenicella sp.]
MFKKILLFIFLTQITHASEHLEPEDSQFSGRFLEKYIETVLSYLSSAYEDDVEVRLIGLPSFSPEYALGVIAKEKKYYIFYESPEIQLWGYESISSMKRGLENVKNNKRLLAESKKSLKALESKYPANPQDIPRRSCKKEIDKDLAEKIIYIWHEMLLGTRYSREPMVGADGEMYHFSGVVKNGIGIYAGQIWSPPSDSKTGKLVKMSSLMSEYCLKGKPETEKNLVNRVDKLNTELRTSDKSMRSTAKASAD